MTKKTIKTVKETNSNKKVSLKESSKKNLSKETPNKTKVKPALVNNKPIQDKPKKETSPKIETKEKELKSKPTKKETSPKVETKEKELKSKPTKKNTSTNKDKNPPTKNKKETITDIKDEKKPLPPIESNLTQDYDLNHIDLDFENEVYDEADIASALEMGFIAQALEAHKAKVAKETHPDFDGESCLDCGEEIPQLRLDMGRIRCVHCQEALERKNKLHGR